MITEKNLTTLADKNYVEIVFKKTSFVITAPINHLFHDGKKSKEYIYENYLFKTIEDAKQNAIAYAYFEIKNNTLINLKDKKFETVKCNSSINC